MSTKTKDVLIRALKTFWQASASYLIVNINAIANAITSDLEVGGFETLKSVGITVLVGAVAAGLSAVWNGFIKDKLPAAPELDFSDEDFEIDITDDDEAGLEEEIEAPEEEDSDTPEEE